MHGGAGSETRHKLIELLTTAGVMADTPEGAGAGRGQLALLLPFGQGRAQMNQADAPRAEAMRTLVAFASSHRQAADTGHARRPRTATLSEVQVKYARRLFSEGEPLRTIGLIMRVAPDDVWKEISKQPRGAGRP